MLAADIKVDNITATVRTEDDTGQRPASKPRVDEKRIFPFDYRNVDAAVLTYAN